MTRPINMAEMPFCPNFDVDGVGGLRDGIDTALSSTLTPQMPPDAARAIYVAIRACGCDDHNA